MQGCKERYGASGFKVQGLESKEGLLATWGLGFKVWGLGFRV